VVAGESLSAICRDWTGRGIPTSTGKALWRHSTLRETLLSARLVGKREHDGALINLHKVPAILPEDLWRQVREVLGPRYARTGRREGRPLSNIALCGICGLPLIGDNDRGMPIYVCRKRPARPWACGGITVQSTRVEARVDEEVVEFLNDKKRVETLLQQHGLSGLEMDAIDARYAELEDNKMALEEAAFNPPAGIKRLPRDRYWELRTQIEREQERLQLRRAVNREAEPLKVALKETWTVEGWQVKALEYRRAILRLVTERIEVHKPAVLEHRGHLGARFDPIGSRSTSLLDHSSEPIAVADCILPASVALSIRATEQDSSNQRQRRSA
jgi:site-specific DNA recombinase